MVEKGFRLSNGRDMYGPPLDQPTIPTPSSGQQLPTKEALTSAHLATVFRLSHSEISQNAQQKLLQEKLCQTELMEEPQSCWTSLTQSTSLSQEAETVAMPWETYPVISPSCSIEMTEEIQQPGSLDSTIWKMLDLQTPPALPSTSTSMPELQSNLRESNGTSRLGTQDLERFHQSGNPKRTLFAATVDTRALPREMINSTLLSRSTEIEKVDVGLTENSALSKDHCHLLIKTKKQIRLSTLQSQLANIPGLIYLKCLSPIPKKGIYTLQQAVEAYRKYMMKSWNGRKPGGKTATNLAHQMENKQSTTRKIQAAIKTGGLQNRFKTY